MKVSFIAVAALASPLVLSVPAMAGTLNILDNSGFETGALNPWFQNADFGAIEAWNVTSTTAHTGMFSATNIGNSSIRQNFAAVATEDIIELSFWLMQPEIAVSAVLLFYSDGSDSFDLIFPSTTEWEFFDVTSFLVSGKELTGFGVSGYEGAGPGDDITYLDDASVLVVPAPSSLALLAFGGIAAGRRRR